MSFFDYMNPYEIHKKLINEYVLKKPGDTKKLFTRDTSKDKTDLDVIRENHQFLWDDEDDTVDSWEKQFAKRYYDKLFKEYCIADLTRYKENKVALRWRIEKEVVSGKGQFICGNKYCNSQENLRSWEVNFAYVEHGEKKNALIKLRLCPECSDKLNYTSKKREIKRIRKIQKKTHKYGRRSSESQESTATGATTAASSSIRSTSSISIPDTDGYQTPSASEFSDNEHQAFTQKTQHANNLEAECWKKSTEVEEKSREEEFDEYLENLLL